MRRGRRIAIWALGAVLVAVAATLGAAWWLLRDLNPPLPPLLADLPRVYADMPAEIEARLAREFPTPAPRAEVEAELAAQGFEVMPDAVTFEHPTLVCRTTYGVLFETEADTITGYDAFVHPRCL